MPDPKLKEAAEEIKAVLRKHDIAAIVYLGSPTHTEFVYELCPSWSCAKVENGGIRIKSHSSEYPSLDAQKKCVEDTAGIFFGFHTLCKQGVYNMESIAASLGSRFDISHSDHRE